MKVSALFLDNSSSLFYQLANNSVTVCVRKCMPSQHGRQIRAALESGYDINQFWWHLTPSAPLRRTIQEFNRNLGFGIAEYDSPAES